MISQAVVVSVLLLIAYEDFRYRSIRIFLFPILAFALFWFTVRNTPVEEIAANAVLNTFYVLLILLMSFLYLYFFRKKAFMPSQYLGVGDLLFLLCVSMCFDPVDFVMFITASMFAAILFHFVLSSLFRRYRLMHVVPLAGYQSFCLLIFIVIKPTLVFL